jgi:hypothetical protein
MPQKCTIKLISRRYFNVIICVRLCLYKTNNGREREDEGVQASFSPAAQVVDSVREKPVCACSAKPGESLVRKNQNRKPHMYHAMWT